MRIVFMGTPEFAVPSLEALPAVEHEIVAVYTQPDRSAGRGRSLVLNPVKSLAQSQRVEVVQPASLRESVALEKLRSLSPDAIVVVAYGQILPEEALSIPPYGCINVHPSLLPRHRGPSPIPWTILEGDIITGVTTMLMDVGMDTGPILEQREIPVLDEDTTATLQHRLAGIAASLLPETLDKWFRGEVRPNPQDESLATYSWLVSAGDGEMNWQLPAMELWRRVRAFNPRPGSYTFWAGRILKVTKVMPFPQMVSQSPGRVVSLSRDDCEVGVETGKGVLGLLRVQMEGKKEMRATDFARGQRDFLGSVLPLQ